MSLSKEIIIKALTRLGELATDAGLSLQVCIYGGSAMLLAYGNRQISRDVDVVIHPATEGLRLAKEVAQEMGLHKDWLNNDVQMYLSPEKDREGRRSYDLPFQTTGLSVEIATANYLLALKAQACREPIPGANVDADDLRFLIKKMEIHSFEQIQKQLDRFFPENPLRPNAQGILDRLIEEVWSEQTEETESFTTRNTCGSGPASEDAGGIRP